MNEIETPLHVATPTVQRERLRSDMIYHCYCSTKETKRQFEIAFKMIDADGNDYLDLNEFSKVSLLTQTGTYF